MSFLVLREPAQSKCAWIFHKSHFAWKLTGKMPDTTDTTSKEHRALTLTIRTPQCGSVATLFGENSTQLPGKVLKMPSLSSVRVQHLHFF